MLPNRRNARSEVGSTDANPALFQVRLGGPPSELAMFAQLRAVSKTSAAGRSIRPPADQRSEWSSRHGDGRQGNPLKLAHEVHARAPLDPHQTCGGFIVLSAEKFHFSADLAASRKTLWRRSRRRFGVELSRSERTDPRAVSAIRTTAPGSPGAAVGEDDLSRFGLVLRHRGDE